jgi:hypothetical protein
VTFDTHCYAASICFHQQEYGLLWVRPMQSIGIKGWK